MASNHEELFPASISEGLTGKNEGRELAKMLRECANIVEKNEFQPIIYETLGLLHSYAGRQQTNVRKKEENINGANKSGPFKIGSKEKSDDWCDECFTKGCSCKSNGQRNAQTNAQTYAQTNTQTNSQTKSQTNAQKKPSFQRSPNPNSNLLATGWIEQQRRSKMRIVWKEVLASLVEGRRSSKEETTLWIQRQINNPSTHKKELEALHQVKFFS